MSDEKAKTKLTELMNDSDTQTEDLLNQLVNYNINDKSLVAKGLQMITHKLFEEDRISDQVRYELEDA